MVWVKIGVDLDEVISETLVAIIQFHNDTYGTRLELDDFKSYRFWETWGGTREEAVDKVHEFFRSPYARLAKPVVGAQNAVLELGKSNELHVITARPEELAGLTHYWIREHFNGAFAEIHFANHFSKIGGRARTKAEICDALGVRMLIEDSADFAAECARDDRAVFLLDRPWNKTELPSSVYRVSSWDDLLKHDGVLR